MSHRYRPRGVPIELQDIIHKLRSEAPMKYRNHLHHKPQDMAAAKKVLDRLLQQQPALPAKNPISSIAIAVKDIEV